MSNQTGGPASDQTGASPSIARRLSARILSGIALATLALIGVFSGGAIFAALVALIAVVMAFEWTRMSQGVAIRQLIWVIVSTFCLVLSAHFQSIWIFVLGLLSGAASIVVATRAPFSKPGWGGVTFPYIVLPAMVIVWMRGLDQGRDYVLMLMVAVWMTDIGAYIVGSTLKGPKFLPRWSPNKTWAGLAGGMVAAGAALAGGASFWPAGPSGAAALAIGATLAVISQLGDVVESAFKRHFGVKDSGRLIPGHGGMLDRLDGMIFAALAFAAALLVYGTTEN